MVIIYQCGAGISICGTYYTSRGSILYKARPPQKNILKEVNSTGGWYMLVKLQEYVDEFIAYFKNNKPSEAGEE